MITIIPIPAAASSATTESLALQFNERICQPFNPETLSASVSYNVESVNEVNGNALATVQATILINFAPVNKKIVRSIVNVETFTIAFTATTNNNITIDGGSLIVTPLSTRCGYGHDAKISTTITATIA